MTAKPSETAILLHFPIYRTKRITTLWVISCGELKLTKAWKHYICAKVYLNYHIWSYQLHPPISAIIWFSILEYYAKLPFAKVLLSLNGNFTALINRLNPANHRLPRPHGDRINSHKLENTTNTLKHRQTTRYNLIRCVQAYLESVDSIYGTMTQNCRLRRFCPSQTAILRHFPIHWIMRMVTFRGAQTRWGTAHENLKTLQIR